MDLKTRRLFKIGILEEIVEGKNITRTSYALSIEEFEEMLLELYREGHIDRYRILDGHRLDKNVNVTRRGIAYLEEYNINKGSNTFKEAKYRSCVKCGFRGALNNGLCTYCNEEFERD